MPYIDPACRRELYPHVEELANQISRLPKNARAGATNFAIFMLICDILYNGPSSKFKYDDLNEMFGALECCKLELYRRLAAPYEQKAMKRNGDIL